MHKYIEKLQSGSTFICARALYFIKDGANDFGNKRNLRQTKARKKKVAPKKVPGKKKGLNYKN